MFDIEDSQRQFYQAKFQEFGDDPAALSWNGWNGQYLRFRRICDLFRHERGGNFTVHEIGCGLGHFKDYMDVAGYGFEYSGSDIVPDFIAHNKEKFPRCEFYLQSISDDIDDIDPRIKDKDYYFLNGVFNTREDNLVEAWEPFVFKSLDNVFRMARKGICASFLTSHAGFFNQRLYYADPCRLFSHAIGHMSRFASVSHEVPLYEFFLFAYKDDFIKSQYPGFERYFEAV